MIVAVHKSHTEGEAEAETDPIIARDDISRGTGTTTAPGRENEEVVPGRVKRKSERTDGTDRLVLHHPIHLQTVLMFGRGHGGGRAREVPDEDGRGQDRVLA